jgi:hypothetical protein
MLYDIINLNPVYIWMELVIEGDETPACKYQKNSEVEITL